MVATWLNRINQLQIWHRPVALSGMRFVPPTLDRWVALQAHRFRLMGSAEFNFFQRFVGPGSRIVDVGANQGIYSLFLSRQVGEGKVYAFEPDPSLFAALAANVELNRAQNVVLFNAAAASRPSKLLLRPGRLNRGDNRIARFENGSAGAIEVAAVTLDQVITDHRVDLLKIDVQGFEFDVLRGAFQIIQANPALLILLEFWPHGLTLAGSSAEELLNLLQEAGFLLFRFNKNLEFQPFVYNPATWSRSDQFCNLVAVRDSGRLNGFCPGGTK
jgi:FkbM family methyltransferase